MLSRCYPGLVPGSNMVLSRCMPVCPGFTTVIALSHIYVPAAYRSRIYENFDTPRSEAYFVQATYGVSRRMCYVRVLYVWRMKCTRDVSTAYVLRSILICGVPVLYQMFLITTCIRTNGCIHFVHAIRILQ